MNPSFWQKEGKSRARQGNFEPGEQEYPPKASGNITTKENIAVSFLGVLIQWI